MPVHVSCVQQFPVLRLTSTAERRDISHVAAMEWIRRVVEVSDSVAGHEFPGGEVDHCDVDVNNRERQRSDHGKEQHDRDTQEYGVDTKPRPPRVRCHKRPPALQHSTTGYHFH